MKLIAFQIGFYFQSSDISVYVFQELSVYIHFLTTADKISTNQNAAIFRAKLRLSSAA